MPIFPRDFLEGRETKKRTTLARLLKGLKTVNRRDRNNQQNGAQARVSKVLPRYNFPPTLFSPRFRPASETHFRASFYDRKQIVCPVPQVLSRPQPFI